LDAAVMHERSHRSLVARGARMIPRALLLRGNSAPSIDLKEAKQGFGTNLFFEVRRLR
jgi:hypothetical protein